MSAPARDPRGVPVGTRSAEALRHAEQGLWRMVSFFGDPLPDLEAAAQADPHWMLPPVMQAGFLLSLTEAPLRAQAQPLLERALARREGAPLREQAHLDAVRLGWQGDWAGACARWDEILLEHPRDLLALLWAHLFDFHRGDAWQLRQRVARVLPQWDAADPLYPYVLGMRAFGLEETHHHAEAEAVGRRALEGGTPVAWAVHAVAHVMEMQGRVDEGAAWLARHQPQWVDNGLAVHLWWHLGLFRLERLDTEGALRLYDTRCSGETVQIAFQRLDATALLWRLQLLGVDGGDRWTALAQGWDRSPEAAGWSAFNDLHVMLALAGSGDVDAAARWLDQVEQRTAAQALPQERQLAAATGLALLRGLLAYARGEDEAAWRLLYPLRPALQRLGGSHAQRDVVDQTLLAAAARGGLTSGGRALVHERQLAKPVTPLTRHWAGRLGVRLD